MTFNSIYGVDFSGARLAGRTIWIARTEPTSGRRRGASSPSSLRVPRLRLVALDRLERLCGTAEREPALHHLVGMIRSSRRALWGMDFPFGLPIEVLDRGATWPRQMRLVREWGDDAYGLGLHCVERARRLGGKWHIRRATDIEARAPLDCYHYRIIYQTFFGMRDVLGPLVRGRGTGTVVLPFQYDRLARGGVRHVVMESCPGSTLKRLGLPHQKYKQPAGGALTPVRRTTRHTILSRLAPLVAIDDRQQRTIMRDGGGDALDAVIAAVGAEMGWFTADHAAIARHPRYRREGYLYA